MLRLAQPTVFPASITMARRWTTISKGCGEAGGHRQGQANTGRGKSTAVPFGNHAGSLTFVTGASPTATGADLLEARMVMAR